MPTKSQTSDEIFAISRNLSGGSDSLAETFHGFIPSNCVTRIESPSEFRWNARLTAKADRMLLSIRSNRDWEFYSRDTSERIAVVTVPEAGALKMSGRRHENMIVPGQALVLHISEDRANRAFCAVGHGRTSFRFRAEEVEQAISIDDEPIHLGALDPVPIIDLSDGRGKVILSLLQAIAFDLVDPQVSAPMAFALMNEAVLRLLFEPAVQRWCERRRNPGALILPRHVKQAVEYIRENASNPIRIADVARSCNVSVRTLENGFRAFKNTTPAAYLRRVRLEAARRDIASPDCDLSVSAIARKWGFVDAGRFARRYQRLFGELPSDTKRKR